MSSMGSVGPPSMTAGAHVVRAPAPGSTVASTPRAGPTARAAGATRAGTPPRSETPQSAPPAGTGSAPPLPRRIDDVDRAILAALAADARMPNNALAADVGIAPSTCLARVRALRESGAILGFHAEIDPAALGLPLQAVISVRLQAGARDQLRAFTDRVRILPQVRSIYFLAGADDFLLHVLAADAAALRDFVLDQLSAHHEVAATETQLIFDHIRGASPSA